MTNIGKPYNSNNNSAINILRLITSAIVFI